MTGNPIDFCSSAWPAGRIWTTFIEPFANYTIQIVPTQQKEVRVFRIRFRFARLSFVSVVATTFFAGVAMTPAFAQATKLSKADQRLLKAAIHSCKSEAKA